jgi:hypothetical protein
MERRRSARARCILACDIVVGRKVVEGVVRNVSEGGLALEAPLPAAETGETLELRLKPPRRSPIEIAAVVWHLRTGRKGAAGPVTRFGLVLSEAGEEYFDLVASLLLRAGRAAAPAPTVPPPLQSFAVQVAQAGSPRTRRILVRAADAGAARARALEETGPEWSVVAVETSRRP